LIERDIVTTRETKPVVALYKGPGAELAEDIAKVIRSKFPFRYLNTSEIQRGLLDDFKLLIMAGGYTARYIPALKPTGCDAIKTFLKNQGGRYLGVCAGAYIAGPTELGISHSKQARHSGLFKCQVTIPDLSHPIFKGITTNQFEVHYQNGPHIYPDANERSLALYSDQTTSVLETVHSLLFSWHPEKLPHTTPILLHSLEYLLSI
jgi:hypothetical protein